MRPFNSKDVPRAQTPETKRAVEQAIHARTVEDLKTEIETVVVKPTPEIPAAQKQHAHAGAHAATVALIAAEMQKREPQDVKRKREIAAQADDIDMIKREMRLQAQVREFSGGYYTPDE